MYSEDLLIQWYEGQDPKTGKILPWASGSLWTKFSNVLTTGHALSLALLQPVVPVLISEARSCLLIISNWCNYVVMCWKRKASPRPLCVHIKRTESCLPCNCHLKLTPDPWKTNTLRAGRENNEHFVCVWQREDTCICIADSLCYTAETNTTL